MTVDDTFPRQHARTQRFTLGAPRNVTVAANGERVAFLRSGGPEDPVTALWALDLPDGEERIVADPAHPAGRGRRRPPARGAGSAGAGQGERVGHHGLCHRRPAPGGGGGAGRPPRGGRSRPGHGHVGHGAERGHRPAPRPDRAARGLGGWAGPVGGRARRPGLGARPGRRGRPGGALGRRRVRGRRGDAAPPGLLVGARRRGAPRHPGRRRTGPPVVDLRPRPPRTTAARGRLSRGGDARRRRQRVDRDGGRVAHGGHVGRRHPPLPGGGGLGRARTAGRPPTSGPAPHRGARRRPCHRHDGAALGRPGRRLGGAGAGHPGPAGRRAGGDVHRRRRRPSAPRRWRPRLAGRSLRAHGRRPRRGLDHVHRQRGRRRHRHLGLALDRRRRRAAQRGRRRAQRVGGGRHGRHPASLDGQRRTGGAGRGWPVHQV